MIHRCLFRHRFILLCDEQNDQFKHFFTHLKAQFSASECEHERIQIYFSITDRKWLQVEQFRLRCKNCKEGRLFNPSFCPHDISVLSTSQCLGSELNLCVGEQLVKICFPSLKLKSPHRKWLFTFSGVPKILPSRNVGCGLPTDDCNLQHVELAKPLLWYRVL